MAIAIRYYSKSGNTKKVADAISKAIGVPAETVDTPILEPVEILFLGSAVYGAGVDAKVKNFITSIDRNKIKKIVNFSTAALLPSTYSQISKLLGARGIPLDDREFHCRGKFTFMHGGRPDEEDLEQAQIFAQAIVNNLT